MIMTDNQMNRGNYTMESKIILNDYPTNLAGYEDGGTFTTDISLFIYDPCEETVLQPSQGLVYLNSVVGAGSLIYQFNDYNDTISLEQDDVV